MFDFDGYSIFASNAKMAEVASVESLRAKLHTLPLIVTHESWYGEVLRCEVLPMTPGRLDVTVDLDPVHREVRCTARHTGDIESLLDDMGDLVGERGRVEETHIRSMKRR